MPSFSMYQSYSGRWFSNSSVQIEWVMPSIESDLAVREVVHRIDAPVVARAMVMGVQDAVHHRVAHVEIRRRHVDLGPQRARAVGKLAGAHPLEQVEVLLDAAVAVRAVAARLGERAAILADLVGVQVADIGLARLDQLHGPLVKLLEIVGGEKQAVAQVEPQPADVVDDRLDVLGLFLAGVRVVEPQVAQPAILLGQAEVQADALGVADVQIAVGFGRKPGVYPAIELAGAVVFLDDILNKVQRRRRFRRHRRGSVRVRLKKKRNVSKRGRAPRSESSPCRVQFYRHAQKPQRPRTWPRRRWQTFAASRG